MMKGPEASGSGTYASASADTGANAGTAACPHAPTAPTEPIKAPPNGMLDDLLSGQFGKYNLTPNFDNPNQTARYDVLTGIKALSEADLRAARAAIKAARDDCFDSDPAGPREWQTTDTGARPMPGGATPVSGMIYVSSNRSQWLGENLPYCPLVVSSLLNGRCVDIVTDHLEFEKYEKAIFDKGNMDNLLDALEKGREGSPTVDPATVFDEAYVRKHLSVVAPKRSAELDKVPRGFGYSRHVGMEAMKARFDGVCATVDDNTFKFTTPTASALNTLFHPGYGPPPAGTPPTPWLSVAFSPSTVSDRKSLWDLREDADMQAGGPAHAGEIRPATLAKPKIIQQFTLWNADRYRTMANPPNYDRQMLTGKEDVELYGRLMRDHADAMFTDPTVSLVKCASSSDDTADAKRAIDPDHFKLQQMKDRAITAALRCQTNKLCPSAPLGLKDEHQEALLAAARSFGVPIPSASVLAKPAGRLDLMSKVLRRQNMVLEQILVPAVGSA